LNNGDGAARRLAQTEFDRPVVLEAGAGTGKTTTLVARTVSWCVGQGWQEHAARRSDGDDSGDDYMAEQVLAGVVAITFTEAAAAEMASKVATALAAIARGAASTLTGFDLSALPPVSEATLQRRALSLLGALDHLTVQTIHAFCRGLLTAYPLEAGLHPDLVVDADGKLLEEIARQVVEQQVRDAFAREPQHPLTRLATLGLGPESLVEAIRELVAGRGLRSQELDRDPLDTAAMQELRARLLAVLGGFSAADRECLRSVRQGTIGPSIARALDHSTAAAEGFAAGSVDELAELLRELRGAWGKNLLRRLTDWSQDKFTASERHSLEGRTRELAAAAGDLQSYLRHLQRLEPQRLDLARRALAPLLSAVERRLRARGVATFQALLLEARNLLARRAHVCRRERQRIRQLLVDEFQDTDRLQCDLIRRLALEGSARQRPGLFVVGDPKQSIYGWRNADLEAYEEFVARALALGGLRHSLTRNFRSAPPILREVERSIQPVMIQQAGLQPRFESLQADRATEPGFTRGRWAPIEYWVSWPAPGPGQAHAPTASSDEVALLEARAVAEDLVDLHEQEGMEWREVGLLLRSTNRLETFLGALRQAGVPFAVSRDKHYYRRREIIEAAALVRAVLNPLDHLALLTTLRSASVGVPDGALIPLWQEGFPGEMSELAGPDEAHLEKIGRMIDSAAARLPPGIPGLERIRGWEVNRRQAVGNLAHLRQAYRREAPDRFLDLLRQRWLLETTEAARYLGPYRLANLDRFFRRLEVDLEETGGDVQAILRALRRGVSEAQEAEEARPKEAAEDAVQVLTIHGSKGLQFRHVYLVQLHTTPGKSGSAWVDADERWTTEEPREYCLFGCPTPGFDRVEARRRRVAANERVRTLYVAMTRAVDRLVLVGHWPESPRTKSPQEAVSHLELLQQRRTLPDSIRELRERCSGEPRGRCDEHDACWRFLGDTDPAGRPRSDLARDAPTLPATAAISHAAEDLRRLRSEAKQRMARPLVAAASAESEARLGEMARDELGRDADSAGREVALAVGREVHKMLETWRFDAKAADELARHRLLVLEALERRLPAALLSPAMERAAALLEGLKDGPLLARLAELAPQVLGREVPVILTGDDGDSDATGCTVGLVDLIYRDQASGRTVIVDYKTDDVEDPDQIEARAAAYLPQVALYQRAVERALGLAEPPAAEIWFLQADRVWRSP
jgi:ATP-dependent helicase/nuclease subunit A